MVHTAPVTKSKPMAAFVNTGLLDKIQQTASTIVAVSDAVSVFSKSSS